MADQGRCVGIVGAGGIACGYAVYLETRGHRARLWSPRGGSVIGPLEAQGALAGSATPARADSAADLVDGADVIIIAVPAYGHRAVMEAIAPHLRQGQPVIVSSQAAFGALYLRRLLRARGVLAPVIAWSTTVLTARRLGTDRVHVGNIRARVDMASVPATLAGDALACCEGLFGPVFRDCGDIVTITLSNLNPPNHMAIALCNATRMDRAEVWRQFDNMTPMVARLVERLDDERMAIARTLGLSVRTVHEHFHLSYGVDLSDDLASMFQAMSARGVGGNGPATPDTRYVTEDVPFGLVPTIRLGQMTGCSVTLHRAGLAIFSAMYGRDFAAECDLGQALGLDGMSLADLRAAAG